MKVQLEETERLKSGLTLRSYLAIMYATLVFQPAMTYLFLLIGAPMAGMVPWVTLLLVSELARMSGSPLTRQEAGTIFLIAGTSTYGIFMGAIYNLYLRHSPIVAAFGMTDKIPPWVSPTSPEPWIHRTFFHPSWMLPLAVYVASFVSGAIADISIGLFLRQMYIVTEKLPFPMQVPVAQAAITFSEGEPKKIQALSLAAAVSMLYGTVTYAIPYVTKALKYQFQVIPVPWVDLNYWVHKVIPGASFGVATSLALIGSGFVIPFNVLLSGVIGSVIVFVIGNWFLVTHGITAFAEEWAPGMSIQMTWQRSLLNAWISPLIGAGIAAGLMPLIRHPRIFIETFRSLKPASAGGLAFSVWWVAIPFTASAIIYVIMIHLLVPDFPLWILILLNIGWIPLMTLISTRSVGVLGFPINIPFVHQFIYIASGYPKYDIWFAPVYSGGMVGQGWAINFKIADLCDIKPTSLIKAWLAAYPISLLLGFVIVSHFWSLDPIPSAAYPGVQIYWPIQATQQMTWIKHPPGLFRPDWISGSFVVFSILYLITDFFRLPISIIGLAAGMSIPIPTAVTVLIGGLIGKALSRIIGRERWNQYKPVTVAGLMLGAGLAVAAATFLVLIIKGIGRMPY